MPANHANAPGAGPEVRDLIGGLRATKRIATPDEIAAAALFLLSDASTFVDWNRDGRRWRRFHYQNLMAPARPWHRATATSCQAPANS